MRRSFATVVAFARNRKCSKIPSILKRADSALATRLTVASFGVPRASNAMLGRHLNSRPNLVRSARGGAGHTTRRPRWHIPDTKPAPVPAGTPPRDHWTLGALAWRSYGQQARFPRRLPAGPTFDRKPETS
jgi:hypothetical protein